MASSLLVLLGTLMAVGTQAGVLHFGTMVLYTTGRAPMISYPFYGCYCGLGGAGWPVDEIDWCCHVHDCCYGAITTPNCFPLKQTYKFTLIKGAIICGDEDVQGCARQCCECDRAASLCFAEQDSYYSKKYRFNLLRKNCFGKEPPC